MTSTLMLTVITFLLLGALGRKLWIAHEAKKQQKEHTRRRLLETSINWPPPPSGPVEGIEETGGNQATGCEASGRHRGSEAQKKD